MASNFGPNETLNKLKQMQKSVRRALRDFRVSIQSPKVRKAFSKKFIDHVGVNMNNIILLTICYSYFII